MSKGRYRSGLHWSQKHRRRSSPVKTRLKTKQKEDWFILESVLHEIHKVRYISGLH